MSRPGIMFYFDMLPALKRLSDIEKANLFEALLEYGQFGVIPTFESLATSVAWDFIQPRIDRDSKAYDAKCQKNRYSVYCREAKKNNQIPVSFEQWINGESETDDIERYQSFDVDAEKENQTQIQTQNKKQTSKGSKGDLRNFEKELDADSFEAKRAAEIQKLLNR